jgi:hypothetical protein
VTATVDDRLARLDAVVAQLERLGLVAPPEVEAFAAGDLPPHVAAGELITSAWGNAVVDEVTRLRAQVSNDYVHAGGMANGTAGVFDCGTQNLGVLGYPARITVVASFTWGFGNGSPEANPLVAQLSDGGTVNALGGFAQAPVGKWAGHTVSHAWQVTAAQNAGFRTSININTLGGGTNCYYQCRGVFSVERTG